MSSYNYNDDIEAWAAHVRRIAQQLRDVNEITKATLDNPVHTIVKMVAEQSIPFYQAVSPVDTGLLRQSHILGETGIGQHSTGAVMGFAEIIIDPNAQENVKYGGYPRDYGPEYHRTKREWFLEAEPAAKQLFETLAAEEFSVWVHTESW